jgi:signal transduction histidine kinase
VVLIILFSYGFFFYLENRTEKEVRDSLFEEQRQRQLESTQSLSQHIGSDLDLVTTRLYALANSKYLQSGDFTSDGAQSFLKQNYDKVDNVVNKLFVLDKDDIITTYLSKRGSESLPSVDLSLRDWVRETKESLLPVLSNGFESLGVYSVYITHPIVNRETNEYIGLVGASIPTVNFFEDYGNVHNINSPFLAVFDKRGILLAVGADQNMVGKNYFGDYVQNFVNHNMILNNLTRSLLSGNSGDAVYDYGRGERLTTQYPVYVGDEPTYFIQVITPTSTIYSNIDSILAEERLTMFILLAGTTAAVAVLILFLINWNNILGMEVRRRTEELDRSNEQLKLANEQLRRHDELQKEFISTAAHELRTPIQPILGLSDVLCSKIKDNKQRELLNIISRNARRLQRLAEDILEIARIESRSLKLDKTQFNLSEAVEDVVDGYRDTEHEYDAKRGVTLILQGSKRAIFVHADKHRITQVIANLLDNAIKFTVGDSSRSITVSVESEHKGDDDYALVKIKDTGRGIDPVIMPHLFTKFSTKSSHGTGLGLFICKSIVEAHGGKIWAANNLEEKGATFFFTLPIMITEMKAPRGSLTSNS